MIELPIVVVVGGAPGTGKTTLALLLSRALHVPLLAKDHIKEPLMDALGVPDIPTQRRIGGAAYEVMYRMAGWLLDAGVGCVLESNFVAGQSEAAVIPLIEGAHAVQLTCTCSESLRRARYEERAQAGDRHTGHLDKAVLGEWDARPASLHAALALDIPHLTVDTSDGYSPSLDAVLAFARHT